MKYLHLMFCSCLYALTYTAWADGIKASDTKLPEHGDQVRHRQEKLAGRANNVNEPGLTNKNAQYPLYTQESHEKKPMSKEERRALRRQINETESMYPKKN